MKLLAILIGTVTAALAAGEVLMPKIDGVFEAQWPGGNQFVPALGCWLVEFGFESCARP